jgi:hypothetical protein
MKGYPGVSASCTRYYTTSGKLKTYLHYKARIMRNGRAFFLGQYDTPQEAARAYREAKEKPPAVSRRGPRLRLA